MLPKHTVADDTVGQRFTGRGGKGLQGLPAAFLSGIADSVKNK